MKLYCIVSLMNLFNCQGLSLTAVSPPAATLAPWAHEIHIRIHLLKSTIELSFGKMCPVSDGVLGKQTLRWWGVAWSCIKTYPCREMRKTVWGKKETLRGKLAHQPQLVPQPQPSYGWLYCFRVVSNWVTGVRSLYPHTSCHWTQAVPWEHHLGWNNF